MKRTLLAFLLLVPGCQLIAQEIKGTVIAGKTGEALEAAQISVYTPSDVPVKLVVSDGEGRFVISGLEPGPYKLSVNHLGYHPFVTDISLIEAGLDLDTIQMKEASIDLREVEVKDRLPMATQKGDTLEFKSDAYKTLPDASAEELVRKMPTVTVEDGRVQAQGEDVQQVLVDGREFFGNDPTAALRSIPAEVIERIQVFDRESDQAAFTGFSDGETRKTLNIITRASMRNGKFGKMYAGYATDDRYTVGLNLHSFDGDRRLSLIGLSNNVNQQNFSTQDLLGITASAGGFRGRFGGGRRGPGGGTGSDRRRSTGASARDFLVSAQGGVSATHSMGLNYTDRWGKNTDITASYFFNHSDNDATEELYREYAGSQGTEEIYTELSERNSRNNNHRLSSRLELKLDSMNSLLFAPRLDAQINNGNSDVSSAGLLGPNELSRAFSDYDSRLEGLQIDGTVLWRHKFRKNRRTLSLNLRPAWAPKDGESDFYSTSTGSSPPSTDTVNQNATLDLNSWSVSADLAYTEPLGRNGMLMLDYRYSYRQEDSDKETFNYDPETGAYTDPSEEYSNVFSNDYRTQEAGLGYSWNRNKWSVTARTGLQWARLDNEQEFPERLTTDHDWINVLPSFRAHYRFSRTKNLMFNYRSRTDLPDIEQLQNVVDNSNPLLLSGGNPELGQARQHFLFLRYSSTDLASSSVFFALLGGGFTKDHIANASWTAGNEIPGYEEVVLQPGGQFILPMNVDGYWNLRSFVTYGFPVQKIKSSLNINLSANYSRSPGMVNGEETQTENTAGGLGLVMSSNISDRIDFVVSTRGNYNWITSAAGEGNDNNFFQQDSRIRLDWIFGPELVFRAELSHSYYSGLSEGYDENYLIWNMGLGKKIFKNQRGELAIQVNDLLKENTNIQRTVSELYVEDLRSNVLKRYFMIKFTYNLRSFPMDDRPDFPRPNWRK